MNEIFTEIDSIMAGFRLQYLEVLNWGTFNNNTWRIVPDGHNSLLTGDIGSGKSTLVDALTCLLVPYQKITFNKAAGADGRERNLLTYVRGAYKNAKEDITKVGKPVYLRPEDNTYSVILANFNNTGYEESVCLAQLFWLKDGKVERIFISSNQPLCVKDHFSNFTDITELRKRLRKTDSIEIFDSFSQYSESFRHKFGMTSDKAIDLFYQTVSMKSVSSLTDFVREQMLERTDVKEHIKSLLERFDNLNKAHEAVVHARQQYLILKPLVEFSVEYGELLKTIERIEEMIKVIPAWFAIQRRELLQKAIEDTGNEIKIAEQTLLALQDDLKSLESKQLGISQDIDNNGGRRLEQIGEEIQRREEQKRSKKKEWDVYDKLAKKCNLLSVENDVTFFDNAEKGKKLVETCQQKEVEFRDSRDQIVIDLRKNKNALTEEENELDSLKGRKSQIPNWLIILRRQICYDLRIHEVDLPFAGELLKVTDEESTEWEGAIERLLYDFGISLLVPKEQFKTVSRYINGKTLYSEGRSRKLTCLEVNLDSRDSYRKELAEDSVVDKVEIKPDSEFYSWIESHLHKSFGDYACLNIEELQHIPFGITREGMVKHGKIRYTKDDRKQITDRRNYILGWSNTEKIKALEYTIAELAADIFSLEKTIREIEKEEKDNSELKEDVKMLLRADDFNTINWYSEVRKIDDLEQERKELLENNDLLKMLQEKLLDVKNEIVQIKQKETDKNQLIGKLKGNNEEHKRTLAFCDEEIIKVPKESIEVHFPFIEENIKERDFRLNTIDGRQEQFRKLFEGDTGELKKLRNKQTRLTTSIIEKMRDIKDHSKAEYSELMTDVEARGEYIDKFNRLIRDDLKRHEERFKEELNRNTIQGIAVFDSQLDKHEKEIKLKIKHINQHLRKIVYDSAKGTYIEIQIDNAEDRRIGDFREDLKKCYMHSLSGGGDLYTEEKYEQVKKILDKLASAEPVEKEWVSTVTDVRQWFNFNASERYEADDTEKEFYKDSGGKSGGQKEKLAYTVLASALAYQFGLQFDEERSRSFRFVVIDEAFGRGSDESTRYGLELFKKLNLQLLIVTPLQKIHIIENHVNSFHFVGNRDSNNSQISNFSLQEYKAEKAKRNSMFQSTSKEEA